MLPLLVVLIDDLDRLALGSRHLAGTPAAGLARLLVEGQRCGLRLIATSRSPHLSETLPSLVAHAWATISFALESSAASEAALGRLNFDAARLDDVPGRCMVAHRGRLRRAQAFFVSMAQVHSLLDIRVTKREQVNSPARAALEVLQR